MESASKRIRDTISSMYDVADVKIGFDYWFFKLLNFCLTIFEYENLPPSLPKREIELNLLLTGHAVIFTDKTDLVTACTTLYNYDRYYNPTQAVFAQPRMQSKTLYLADNELNRQNAVVIYNNDLKDNILYIPSDGALLTFISRYARRLADLESSENIYAVNTRLTSFPVGSTDGVIANIKKFFNSLTLGKREVITDDAIINSFRNVDITRTNTKESVNDIITARDKVLEQFFRDIGVKMFADNKKAQLTDNEVDANNQLLLISLESMLKSRQDGIDAVNEFYGTNIEVKISDNFNRENFKSEVLNNE